jgi:hypothetical protein
VDQIFCLLIKEQKPPPWTLEYYKGVFDHHKLGITRLVNAEYRGKPLAPDKEIEFLCGIDIAANLRNSVEQSGGVASNTTAVRNSMRQMESVLASVNGVLPADKHGPPQQVRAGNGMVHSSGLSDSDFDRVAPV